MAMEFCAPQEVRRTLTQGRSQPKSYASRSKTSATFIGRNLMERAGRGAHDVSSVCKMEGEDGHGRFHDLDTGELRSFLALPKKWDTLALAAEESRDFKVCVCVCLCVEGWGEVAFEIVCVSLCIACTQTHTCACVCCSCLNTYINVHSSLREHTAKTSFRLCRTWGRATGNLLLSRRCLATTRARARANLGNAR